MHNFLRRCLLQTTLLALLCVITPLSLAAVTIEISDGWLFKSGYDESWSSADLDDNDWSPVEVPKLLFQNHQTPVIGWYRNHFDFIEPNNEKLSLFVETIRHGDETWLNGTKIGGQGTTYRSWDFQHTNPQSLPRLYPIPDYLLKETGNVLVIKTNVGFGEAWGAMFPGGAGITKGKVLIGDYDSLLQEKHQSVLEIITIDTIFAVLGIIDLIIVIVLAKTALGPIPEFKWLLLCSFFLLMGAAAHDLNYVYPIGFIDTNLLMFTAMLVLPYTTAMYFWSQYRDLSHSVISFFSMTWAASLFVLLIPIASDEAKNLFWYIWNVQAVLFFFYSIVAATKGLVYKRIGGYAQFVGLIIYIISIRSQWLPEDMFGHRNIQFGSIVYRYAILFAYFQQLTHMRVDYKNLSIRTVNITEDVRQSIARELHDGIGQHLAAAKLQTNLAQHSANMSQHLEHVVAELDKAVQGLRRLISGLHPVIIDQTDICHALEVESGNIKKLYNVQVSLDAKNVFLDKQTEIHVFRIFQECTFNAIKHGKATEIHTHLSTRKDHIHMIISDNGKGFMQQNLKGLREDGGYGFISLQERITLLNGRLDITSEKGKGCSVRINFPLKK